MENIKWIVFVLAVATYVLAIVFKNRKIWFTSCAAAVVILLGIIYPDSVFPLPEDIVAMDIAYKSRTFALIHTLQDLISWNIIMIFSGGMIITSLFLYSNIPSRFAAWAVNSGKKTGFALAFIIVLTAGLSLTVDRSAVLLIVVPVAASLCSRLNINLRMFTVALVFAANAESFAVLTGSPASMVFAAGSGFTFNDYFVTDGRMSIFFIIQITLVLTCLPLVLMLFRKPGEKAELEKEKVVSWVPLFLLGFMLLSLIFFSFVHPRLTFLSGFFVFLTAAAGLLWYAFIQKKHVAGVVKLITSLNWEPLAFILGIFVLAGAVKDSGVLAKFASGLSKVTGNSQLSIFVIILLVSVAVSSLIEQMPFVAVMIPVAQALVENSRDLSAVNVNVQLYLFAIAAGCCFGSTLTPLGSVSNLTAMEILKKENQPLSFKEWVKQSLPFTLSAVVVSAVLLWIIWA